MSRWAVVLAGGIGSRFWPLSTPDRPKQLLPLVSSEPLLCEAVDRLRPIVPMDRVLILTNPRLVPAIAQLVPDMPPTNVIAEPRAGGTAAALTWAAQEIARRDGPNAVMISVHADWSVADAAGFQRALVRAAEVAERHAALVTVGVVPTRADPGFGYIQPGEPLDGDARRVARFVEKPERARAEEMRRDGYLWNSGIFVWRVGDFLDDVRRLTPEIAPALHAHAHDIAAFFATVTPISVDVGVLERSNRVAVLAGAFGWDDVGTWGALKRVRTNDSAGNALHGHVYAVDSRDNVVHASDATVVLYGVSNVVVVAHDGLVLITTVDRSSDLKTLMDALPRGVRDRG
ncbi:MAG TPA: mannose-1-phosphate guanylyltransferase [Gemmatimonadaceae bacterium]|jgi:mannose-1-phosphate guanylyltransferase|nr:mannose-1-phosphate guanylyltransferase [Gemmatimonadaceae bacterium]